MWSVECVVCVCACISVHVYICVHECVSAFMYICDVCLHNVCKCMYRCVHARLNVMVGSARVDVFPLHIPSGIQCN